MANKRFSTEEIQEADWDGVGFCISCGEQSGPVEPDARRYACEECGKKTVYGASEILFMGLVD